MLHTYHEIILMEWAEFSRNWVDFCIHWNWLDLIGTWSRKWVITQELNCTWEWSPSRASIPTNTLGTRLYLASPVSCILYLWTVRFTHVHMTWKTCTNLPSCGIGLNPPSNSIPCLSDTDANSPHIHTTNCNITKSLQIHENLIPMPHGSGGPYCPVG